MKPTAKQAEILDLMANGYRLTLVGGIDPWAYLLSDFDRDRIRVRVDTPFHLLRKGLIEQCESDWRHTTYKLKDK